MMGDASALETRKVVPWQELGRTVITARSTVLKPRECWKETENNHI